MESKRTDVRPVGAVLYFLPLRTRLPLKFGPETVTSVTCARVALRVRARNGQEAVGWGETPLSVQWVWPSSSSYEGRHEALKLFCVRLCDVWAAIEEEGHPMEVGYRFVEERLPAVLKAFNAQRGAQERMPWLAALVCASAFDLALHDAFGQVHKVETYRTYTSEFMNSDLARFLEPAAGNAARFEGRFVSDFLEPRRESLAAWHLVGGKDWLDESEVGVEAPSDGYPVHLREWIARDGLYCLKVKLRGDDREWDYERLLRVGRMAMEKKVRWLTVDFNCTVKNPAYVTEILDQLKEEESCIYGMILYVEQPFPYDLEEHRIDVHSVSARKPLFMDESAHDWRLVRLGRELGWSGVALKTCKTQTGALLSLCWAKAHGMTLMVQDLTNPMLAQIPHLLLAAHAGTIMGVETNAMQFYPEASLAEAHVHPAIYRRQGGQVRLESLRGPGFGYRLEEIPRLLPEPVKVSGQA